MGLHQGPHVGREGELLHAVEVAEDDGVVDGRREAPLHRQRVPEADGRAPHVGGRDGDVDDVPVAQRARVADAELDGGDAEAPITHERDVAALERAEEGLHGLVGVAREAAEEDETGGVDFLEADGASVDEGGGGHARSSG